MDEFAKMIFEQWLKEQNYDVDFFSNDGKKILDDMGQFFKPEVVDKIYDLLCDNGEELMKRAFTAGFGYACKCLSNGKIEFTKD